MLPDKKVTRRGLAKIPPGWEHDALEGNILMRDGRDYVNNDARYDRAHSLLQRAYERGLEHGASRMDLARICLWDGICIQENLDRFDARERNDNAIARYKKGLDHARYVRDAAVLPVRMSLYNSLGVAYHHRNGKEIPDESFVNYKKAKDIYDAHPEQREALEPIMQKVATNSGRVLGGASGGAHFECNYVA